MGLIRISEDKATAKGVHFILRIDGRTSDCVLLLLLFVWQAPLPTKSESNSLASKKE